MYPVLLRQGLAFRGHDESYDSLNRGNFLEALRLLANNNDKIAKVMLQNAPENHQMTAPCIKKDIANAIASEVTQVIINDLGEELFGIIVDESRDISVKEQMIVFIRYVHSSWHIVERLLGITHVCDTTSMSLKVAIENLLTRHGLSISRIRGQGYDGASNRRGEFNGLKTLIMNENPSAFYVHCFAHQLQLALVGVAKENEEVGNFFFTVSQLCNIVCASFKRMDSLRDKQLKMLIDSISEDTIETGTGLNQEELNNRFNEKNTELLLCVTCFDPKNSFVKFDKDKLVRLTQFYPNDFSDIELQVLDNQLQTYFVDVTYDPAFSKLDGIDELAQKMVETGRHLDYTLVYLLLKLSLVLPVATASVERAFSAMKLIKTSFRNRMGDDLLNDCLVPYVEKDIFNQVSNEAVLQRFQHMRERRGILSRSSS
ncbi:PREDICTED: zinc finger MYM-type protein 1-like [Ipomoea nil]|uniref:zinc finger MYM-type protein 1-like n=1 Tax=Ipomoea nil TaxID=35883 RepID=UPI0009017233|nr:PREDICTED: zinc finger MYM-type protein 1-like [Ipomoea nil]